MSSKCFSFNSTIKSRNDLEFHKSVFKVLLYSNFSLKRWHKEFEINCVTWRRKFAANIFFKIESIVWEKHDFLMEWQRMKLDAALSEQTISFRPSRVCQLIHWRNFFPGWFFPWRIKLPGEWPANSTQNKCRAISALLINYIAASIKSGDILWACHSSNLLLKQNENRI